MKTTKTTKRRTKLKNLVIPDCKHFTGYKPCFPGINCLGECEDPQPYNTKILIVNLEAMGNVLVTTTLLPAIKRKYPKSTIYWITLKNAAPLLEHNQYIERVYVWGPENWLILQTMQFDIVMNIDKAVHAGAFTMSLNAKKKFGYGIDKNAKIIPLTKEAEYNYKLGLDDYVKFRVNQKANTQLLTEAMGLKYKRDEYILNLTKEEIDFCQQYKREILDAYPVSGIQYPVFVGFNTGCSYLYPNKKLTIDQHVVLINEMSKRNNLKLVLLGGPEDTERNAEIVRQVGNKVISTPTTEGVRRGVCYENICDIVITGDSLGMHIAIGLKKHIIVWFGVTCPQEIELFERGVKLIPEGLECSPCWKKQCPYNLECVQMVDLERIVLEVEKYCNNHK